MPSISAITDTLHIASLVLYATGTVVSIWEIKGRRVSRACVEYPVVLGWLGQLSLLIIRWKGSGHVPVTGLFETQHFLAIWVVSAALYFRWRYKALKLFPAALAFAILSLLFASIGPRRLVPLTPAIDTPLFLIHVATSFSAYGLFGVGAVISIYRIIGVSASELGEERRMLDESLYIGYILFSWCMIAGSLWAYLSWGSYWTWKMKGLWSYLLWFYYSGILHIRNRPGWQNRPLNLLTVLGFVLVLFTYLGLGLLLETSHPLL